MIRPPVSRTEGGCTRWRWRVVIIVVVLGRVFKRAGWGWGIVQRRRRRGVALPSRTCVVTVVRVVVVVLVAGIRISSIVMSTTLAVLTHGVVVVAPCVHVGQVEVDDSVVVVVVVVGARVGVMMLMWSGCPGVQAQDHGGEDDHLHVVAVIMVVVMVDGVVVLGLGLET
jgi:hypothetical protein